MVKPARADRRVALFEDGDLWRDEEANPPESPAGWYFRPPGTSAVWVGPYPTADEASSAPVRGDPLAAARRRLEDWRRSRAEPPRAGSGRHVPRPDEPRKPAVAPPASEETLPAGQLALDLGPASDGEASDETRRPPRSRRTRRGKASGAMQEVLPLGLEPQD